VRRPKKESTTGDDPKEGRPWKDRRKNQTKKGSRRDDLGKKTEEITHHGRRSRKEDQEGDHPGRIKERRPR